MGELEDRVEGLRTCDELAALLESLADSLVAVLR